MSYSLDDIRASAARALLDHEGLLLWPAEVMALATAPCPICQTPLTVTPTPGLGTIAGGATVRCPTGHEWLFGHYTPQAWACESGPTIPDQD